MMAAALLLAFCLMPALLADAKALPRIDHQKEGGAGKEEGSRVGAAAPKDRLVLLQALWRHGDRAPLEIYKNDPNRADSWPWGPGNISPTGMMQQLDLGRRLRRRYDNFVNREYHAPEIYVRSSDYNRTLVSATSNFIGFFENAQPGVDHPEDSRWPHGYVPIPVHTVGAAEDRTLLGLNKGSCPRYAKVLDLVTQTPEFKETLDIYRGTIDELSKVTGEPMDVTDSDKVYDIMDTYKIDRFYNKTPTPGFTDSLYRELVGLQNRTGAYAFGRRLRPLNGVDFDVEFGKSLGGALIGELVDRAIGKRRCELERDDSDSDPKPGCSWLNSLKYYAYSAHDTTIAALFAALGFPETNWRSAGFAPYASCVAVELWESATTGGYYLKVLYIRPDDSVENMTVDVSGCGGGQRCDLDTFARRSLPYRLDNWEEFCRSEPGQY